MSKLCFAVWWVAGYFGCGVLLFLVFVCMIVRFVWDATFGCFSCFGLLPFVVLV